MSIDPQRFRELCAKGLTAPQIATRLGVSQSAVHQACKRLNVTVAAAPRGKTGIYSASSASPLTASVTTGRSDGAQ
jgi:hypothetical protein